MKHARKIFSFLLPLALLCCMLTPAMAASSEAETAANSLHELGLFNGMGTDANGNIIYALDQAPTRHEAVTMMVRLLGKEDEALSGNWNTPFTDVVDWAQPYVGYAYANGLTNGTSTTTYSGNRNITASEYLTLVLRALGYQSGTDFQWNAAWELSDRLGITKGQYQTTQNFTRGDVAIISYNALSAFLKGTSTTLLSTLNTSSTTPAVPAVNTLVNYILSYGKKNDDGSLVIVYSYTYEDGDRSLSGITYHPDSNTLNFKHFLTSADYDSNRNRGSFSAVSFDYDVATGRTDLKIKVLDKIGSSVYVGDADFNIASYTDSTQLYFRDLSGAPLSNAKSKLANPLVQLSVLIWNGQCQTQAGVSLRDLGFASYTF